MRTLDTITIADLVTENIKTADVFKKNGIDFCCGGGISIKKACEKKGLDYETLMQELELVSENKDRAYDYNAWDLDFLIGHIVNVHHTYVEDNMGIMKEYALKVARVHGEHYPELIEINSLVVEVCEELASHMKKEELILFPFVQKMFIAEKENKTMEHPHFGTVNNPIAMMEEEHEHAGDAFQRINELTNGYTLPQGACNTFRALYAKLEEFENDLHRHVHLENNILFPKTKALESRLFA